MKKLISALIVASMLISSVSAGVVVPDVTADYGLYGFEDASLAEKLKDAVVMRAYNTHAYVRGMRDKIDYGSEYLAPFKDNNSVIYVPAAFVANMFGADVSENEEGTEIVCNETSVLIREGEVPQGGKHEAWLYERRLCVSAEDMAKILQKQLFVYNDIIIFCDNENIFDLQKDKKELKELENTLAYNWKNVNLAGQGFITNVIKNPLDGMLYCATDVGGAYRYEPESDMWIQLFDWMDSTTMQYEEVCGIGFDPEDENTVYMACGKELLKTSDKGRTWSKANLAKTWAASYQNRFSGENIMVDPNNSNVIFVGTDYDGLWYSDDKTETWRKIESVPSSIVDSKEFGVRCIWFDEQSEVAGGKTQVVYVSSNGHGLYKSENGGASFTLIEGSPKYIRRYVEYDGGWLITADTGLYKFKNGKFENFTPDIVRSKSMCSVTVHPDNRNLIVVGTQPFNEDTGQGTYITYDGGENWAEVPRVKLPWGSHWSDCIFDPYKPEDLIYMTGAGCYKLHGIFTNDVNKMYSERFTYGIEELCMNTLLSLPKHNEEQPLLIEGFMDYGGGSHKNDLSASHRKLPFSYGEGLGSDFCASDPSIVVRLESGGTGQQSGGHVLISYDYGVNWEESPSWQRNEIPMNVAVSTGKQKNGLPVLLVYTVYTNSIYRSEDMGKSWEKLDIPEFWTKGASSNFWSRDFQVVCSDKVKGNVFYICDNSAFLRSTDFGRTWVKMSDISGNTDYKMEAMPGSVGEVWSCRADSLQFTTDGGATWQKVAGFEKAKGITFGRNKADVSYPSIYTYAVKNGDEDIFRSDDKGKTWVKINYGMEFPGVAMMKGDLNVYGRVYVAKESEGVRYGEFAETDTRSPVIEVAQKSTSDEKGADYATDEKRFVITGSVNKTSEVRINDVPLPYSSNGSFEIEYELEKGDNHFRIEAVDRNGNKAEPVYLNMRYDPEYVGITLETDEFVKTKSKSVEISGRANKPCTVYINEIPVKTDENLHFVHVEELAEGDNVFKIYATDGVYKSETKTVEYIYDKTAPVFTVGDIPQTTDENYIILTGKTDEDATIRINRFVTDVLKDKEFSTLIALENGENEIVLQAKDSVNNISQPVKYSVTSSFGGYSDFEIDVDYTEDVEFTGNPEEDFGTLPFVMTKVIEGMSTNICKFGLKWNEENLYVGVRVTDDKLNAVDDNSIYSNDCIEVYLDGGNEKSTAYDKNDMQLMFGWNGVSTAGPETKCVTTDDGYTMEIAIPWHMIQTEVSVGQKIGFDIDCCDNDGGSARAGVTGFAGTLYNFEDTSNFATLTLVKGSKE